MNNSKLEITTKSEHNIGTNDYCMRSTNGGCVIFVLGVGATFLPIAVVLAARTTPALLFWAAD